MGSRFQGAARSVRRIHSAGRGPGAGLPAGCAWKADETRADSPRFHRIEVNVFHAIGGFAAKERRVEVVDVLAFRCRIQGALGGQEEGAGGEGGIRTRGG